MSSSRHDLLDRITSRRARAGVVGLGYVGLPLAVELARAGFETVGIDLDPPQGRRHQPRRVVHPRRARRTRSPRSSATGACAPRPTSRVVRDARHGQHLRADAAAQDEGPRHVVHRVGGRGDRRPTCTRACSSSSSRRPIPGRPRNSCSRCSSAAACGRARDFFLAFSPERVDPGNPTFQTRNVPKVVGGITPDCSALAAALYGTAIETVVPVSSTRVAEMVKLLENTFRAVNIGLVNEIALMCDRLGIDVWEVVDAAKTKPFGFMPFYPGPGLGGHCIPIDPFYLSWKARQSGFEARFIELAGQVNGAMPHFVVDKIAEALNTRRKAVNGSTVLVAGVAYKRDIDDIRESPALDVHGRAARDAGRACRVTPTRTSPHARGARMGRRRRPRSRCRSPRPNARRRLRLRGDSDRPQRLRLRRRSWMRADLVVDTRNAIKRRAPHVFRLGAPRRPRPVPRERAAGRGLEAALMEVALLGVVGARRSTSTWATRCSLAVWAASRPRRWRRSADDLLPPCIDRRGGAQRGRTAARAHREPRVARLPGRPARDRRRVGRIDRRDRGDRARRTARSGLGRQPGRSAHSTRPQGPERQGGRAQRGRRWRRVTTCWSSPTRASASRPTRAALVANFADPRRRRRVRRARARLRTGPEPVHRQAKASAATGATRSGSASRESAVASMLGATGAIYAMRRSAWRPLPPRHDPRRRARADAGRARRLAGVFDPEARAFDVTAPDTATEQRRKTRTLAGNWQMLALEPRLLAPGLNPVWLQYLSHKVGRLARPVRAGRLLPGAAWPLAGPRRSSCSAAVVQLRFCTLAAYGAWLERRSAQRRGARSAGRDAGRKAVNVCNAGASARLAWTFWR